MFMVSYGLKLNLLTFNTRPTKVCTTALYSRLSMFFIQIKKYVYIQYNQNILFNKNYLVFNETGAIRIHYFIYIKFIILAYRYTNCYASGTSDNFFIKLHKNSCYQTAKLFAMYEIFFFMVTIGIKLKPREC